MKFLKSFKFCSKDFLVSCLYVCGAIALLVSLIFSIYKAISHKPIMNEIVIRDTVLVVKPADTVYKFVQKIVYKTSKPETVYYNVGSVDSFLIEHPRGITEISKRKNTVKVKAYFSDTAKLYVFKVPHSNYDVLLTYNDVRLRSPRLKVDYMIGIYGGKNFATNSPEIGINGVMLFNEKFGIQGCVSNSSLTFGFIRKF